MQFRAFLLLFEGEFMACEKIKRFYFQKKELFSKLFGEFEIFFVNDILNNVVIRFLYLYKYRRKK